MDIKEHWQVWSIIFFNKKARSGISVNEHIAEEIHKPVIEKFRRRKVNIYRQY